MASRAFLIAIFIAVAIAPTLAADHKVGGDAGWNPGVNYTEWATGKDFHVGDTLMFVYTYGLHNVWKVNQTDFQQCVNSNASQVPLVTGNDRISLNSSGKKWYICGVPEHCAKGMKLVINVSDAEGPAPSPKPSASAAVEVSPLRSSAWMLAMMAVYRIIVA
ncbi:hypothetical protein CDL12_09049 [Handroanthus impetiginosus]|uniref:Phytocyanin domain-containing protein n=1 Tax=Handroanthus impetiginosus TaxID=429701 RepID=A0A2G9HLV5_9LAMI|nr:hypothetical protein CDL12_09049 [Handroanthus impetiginosus]